MKKINKKVEPTALTEYRAKDNSHFDNMPKECKEILQEALLEEQGYICAYCMRRIPVKDNSIDTKIKIEHILCRSDNDKKTLDYKNMVICCPGSINGSLHCDASKGKKDISFDMFSDYLFTTLRYNSKDGEITSTNDTYNYDIENILRLNNLRLKRNRIEAFNGVVLELNKIGWNRHNINAMISKYKNRNSDGKYFEFCEAIIYYLRNSLKRYNN